MVRRGVVIATRDDRQVVAGPAVDSPYTADLLDEPEPPTAYFFGSM